FGQRSAESLAAKCWPVRTRLMMKFLKARPCVDRALRCKGQPAVIADGADATNSGGGGDSVHLLQELVRRKVPGGALTIMVDPAAVAPANRVGVGAAFHFAVGGK